MFIIIVFMKHIKEHSQSSRNGTNTELIFNYEFVMRLVLIIKTIKFYLISKYSCLKTFSTISSNI